MNKKPCIFLDRDGVLNREIGEYVYREDHFEIIQGVPQSLIKLHDLGYLLIIMTNQGGISQNLYEDKDVWACFERLQKACQNTLDDMYFAPIHPSVSKSLSFKPGHLMFEKAIAKYNIEPSTSWMVGDRETDLLPAAGFGMKTVWLTSPGSYSPIATAVYSDLQSWVWDTFP